MDSPFRATHRLVSAELASEKTEYGQSVMLHEGNYFDRATWHHGGRPIRPNELESLGYVVKPITKRGKR